MLIVVTVLSGVVYPLVVTAIAQVAFHDKADGSLVEVDGEVVGSSLIGQHSRAASTSTRGRRRPATATTRSASSGSNLGPDQPRPPRHSSQRARRRLPRARTASAPTPHGAGRRGHRSGSGLDPHISVANARLQAPRVAEARGSTLDVGARPRRRAHRRPRLGFLGEPGVNVLELNLALDAIDADDRRREHHGAWHAAPPHLPRRRAGRRQDLRHAQRGPAGARARHATSSSASSRPTAGRDRRADRRPRGRAAPAIDYRGATFEEMDVDAILARRPERALVDELAHTNVPGCRNEKRWQDVEELLDAGIDVISTVNIQHLESLNDVVERITGINQRETIPDESCGAADQVELVDMTPGGAAPAHGPRQHLRAREDRRRARQLLPRRQPRRAARAGAAVGRRPGRRRRSRSTASATASPSRGRRASGSSSPSPARPAARRSSGGRRASPSAAHGELLGVHVRSDDGLAGPSTPNCSTSTASCSTSSAASTTRSPAPTSPPRSSTSPAPRTPPSSCSAPATARAGPSSSAARSSTACVRLVRADRRARHLARGAPDAATRRPARPAASAAASPLSPRRQLAGWVLAVVGIAAAHAGPRPTPRRRSGCRRCCSLYLLLVVDRRGRSAVRWPALVAAVAAFLLRELVLHAAVSTR